MVLYIDESIHGANDIYLPKRLYLYSFNNGEPIEDYNKDQTVDFNPFSRNTNKYTFGGFLQYDSSNNPISYKFDITNHVSNIIRHDSLNIDLGLTITSDIVPEKLPYASHPLPEVSVIDKVGGFTMS